MIQGQYVLGLCGRSGSGKTPLRKLVTEQFAFMHKDVYVTWMSFASPIKAMLAIVGVEKGHPLYRDMAQRIGQMYRDADPNFWVDITEGAIAGLSKTGVVILDDVRYPNEAEKCDLLVRVYSEKPSTLTAEQMVHPSERGWEQIPANFVAHNTHPGQLEEAADWIVTRIVTDLEKSGAA